MATNNKAVHILKFGLIFEKRKSFCFFKATILGGTPVSAGPVLVPPPKDDEGDRRPAEDKIGFQYSAGAKSKDQLLALAGPCTVGLQGKNPPENWIKKGGKSIDNSYVWNSLTHFFKWSSTIYLKSLKLLAELKDLWIKKSHHEVNQFLAGFSNLKPLCSTLALGTTICMASSFTPKNTGDTGNLSTYLNFEVPWVEIPGRYYSLTLILVLIVTLWAVCTRRGLAQPSTMQCDVVSDLQYAIRNNTICPKRNHFFLKRDCLIAWHLDF